MRKPCVRIARPGFPAQPCRCYMLAARDDSRSVASGATREAGMSHHNSALVRRWFDEVWNGGNFDAVDELLAPGGVLHDASMADVGTLEAEAFKAHARAMRNAIPDIRFTVEYAMESGDYVAARVTVTGTHTGRGLGIEPTGRAFKVTGMVMAHV